MERPVAFLVPVGSALYESRTLEINPTAPPQEDDGPRLSLSMLVDNQPCDCIYISQAAINEHKLPNTQAGWYFQLPDQAEGDERDEVPFTLRYVCAGRMNKYRVVHVRVDGQLAENFLVNDGRPRAVKGFTFEDRGMKLHRPFFLRKALFGEESTGGDDGSTDEDVAAATGTITVQLYEAVPDHRNWSTSSITRDFKQNRIAPNKKVAFGINKSVAPGPPATIGRWIPSGFMRGPLLCELVVRYRSSTFFAPLRHRANRQPVETIVVSGDEDDDVTAGGDVDEEGEAAEGARAKKRIKREHPPPATTNTGEPLQAQSDVDTFLCRLADKEEMKTKALKFLLMELNQRGLTTVGAMRQTTPEQWKEILHNAHLPAKSLVPSIMELVGATSSSSSSTSGGGGGGDDVIIILD